MSPDTKTTQTPQPVPAKPDADETPWQEEDLWEVTQESRRVATEVFTKTRFMLDLRSVSEQITDEINADPNEVMKIRRARADARAGRRSKLTPEERSL